MEMLRKFVKYFSVHFVAPRKRRLKRTFMYKCQMYQLTWLHLHTQMFNLNATLYFSTFFFLLLSSFNLVFFLKSLQFNGIPVPPLHSTSTLLNFTPVNYCGWWLLGHGTNAMQGKKETTEEKINLTNFCLRQNSLSHATIHPTYFLNKWVAVWKQPTKISAFTFPYPDIHVHMSGLDIATGITAAGVWLGWLHTAGLSSPENWEVYWLSCPWKP